MDRDYTLEVLKAVFSCLVANSYQVQSGTLFDVILIQQYHLLFTCHPYCMTGNSALYVSMSRVYSLL